MVAGKIHVPPTGMTRRLLELVKFREERFDELVNTPIPLAAFGPCVDGSGLARVFFTRAAVVGAAMCSAC
jgi:hypothetical protein